MTLPWNHQKESFDCCLITPKNKKLITLQGSQLHYGAANTLVTILTPIGDITSIIIIPNDPPKKSHLTKRYLLKSRGLRALQAQSLHLSDKELRRQKGNPILSHTHRQNQTWNQWLLLAALPQTPAANTPLALTRDPSPAGGWLQFLVHLPQFWQVVLEDHATLPSAPAPFRHQTGTPVMPASLSHQVLNLTASPSSSAGISPHLGTLPSARATAGIIPWGRNVHGSTPNTPPDT